MVLNVHQLNVFVTAADTLNFTQTAKRLHLTQSSVSQHIKSLESQLDMNLFIRNGRTLEITDEGRVLLPMARDLVEGSIRATQRMASIKKEVHGHLIIGCNTATGKYMLPTLLAGFSEEYPLVRFTCQVLPQEMTLKRLAEGEMHFAFTNANLVDEGRAEFQLYFLEPLVLIASPDHPWSTREFIEPEELTDERFIMREPSSGTYSSVSSGLAELGVDIEKLDVLMEMGTSEAIALAVQQGLGVGFVSKMIVDKICQNQVCDVKVRGLNVCQKVYFGRQLVLPVSAAQVAFWNFIRGLDTSIFKTPESAP